MNVLLIEEHDSIRDDLATELQKAGYTVTAFASADRVETPGFNLQDYQAVITDVDAPLMNGMVVSRAIAQEHKPIPCLMHSWNRTVETITGTVNLPAIAKLHDWLHYHERGVGRVGYIWNFLDMVERSHL
ncbi:response regulator [Candidatus Kaiserbacteria bacterium]|nr:response regulator [Candidatus Kaiserbacteria bacterium]